MGCCFSEPVAAHKVPLLDLAKHEAKHAEQDEHKEQDEHEDFSCSCCCQAVAPHGASAIVSSPKGVNAKFLLHFRFHMSRGMKTWQVKKEFTLRATAASKCPLVEILKPEYVGKANVFVSHAYSYALADSVEVMLRYEETHPGSVYWFDPFSLNQHPTPSGTVPTEQLISAFGDRIKEFEATLIVASPWDNPAFLARAW